MHALRVLLPMEPVAKTTLGSSASICVGRPMMGVAEIAGEWDKTLARAANRDTSPTTQVPKLFGPLCATASMQRGSAPGALGAQSGQRLGGQLVDRTRRNRGKSGTEPI
jgi:hypothetical protein